MNIYTNHWLYNYIPRHRIELARVSTMQKILWAAFGNDDDGIFGEGPQAGRKWTIRWGGNLDEQGHHKPGSINFKRFVLWQLRNPLHNFTAYVIGFRGARDISLSQLILISTTERSCYKTVVDVNPFPMRDSSGFYLGLCNKRPFLSWRVNLIGIGWMEGYVGWRPQGSFGLSFRLKKTIK